MAGKINLPTLIQRISVDGSDATKGLSGVQSGLGKVSDAATSAGKKATIGLTLPIVGFGVAGATAAIEVEKGLREVNTLFGLTGDEAEANFEKMREGVAGLSNEIGIAQDVLVGGLYSAISAGVPEDNALEFLEVAAKAGVAGVTDTETAIDGLTTTINAFGLEASEVGAVSDSMFAAVQGGKTTFGELSDALFNVAPAAAAAGVSFQEVNASIATLTASGVPTSVATTQLRAALTGLQRPSEDLDKIFQALGYTNAQAAIEAEGLGFALGAVKDASNGSNGRLTELLGSVEAVGAANIIAGTGAEKFSAEMERQADAAGSTETAFEEMEKSSSRDLERLKVSVQNLTIELGNALLPVVEKITGAFQGVADWLNTLDPKWKDLIVQIGGVLAVAGPVLLVIGKIAGALSAVAGVVGAIGLGPLALILAAVAAAAALVYTNWDKIEPVLKNVWERIQNDLVPTLKDLWESAQETFTSIAAWAEENWPKVQSAIEEVSSFVRDDLVPILQQIATTIQEKVGPILQDVADRLLPILKDALQSVQDAFANVVAWVRENWPAIKETIVAVLEQIRTQVEIVLGVISWIWEAIGDDIMSLVEVAWNFIRDTIGAVMKVIQGIIETVMALIRGDWGAAWDGIKTILAGVWDAIRGIIEGALGTIQSVLGGIFSILDRTIGRAFVGIRDFVWGKIEDLVGFVRDLPTRLLAFAGDLLSAGATLGGNILQGIIDGISGVIEFAGDLAGALTDLVKNAWNSFVGVLNAATPDSIGWGFASIDVPDNPWDFLRLARGGPFGAGQPLLVGEEGPEIMVPGAPGVVAPRNRLEDLVASVASDAGGGGRAGDSFQIQIDATERASADRMAHDLAWGIASVKGQTLTGAGR